MVRPRLFRDKRVIAKAIRDSHGNLAVAAQKLGIGRSTLYRYVQRYGTLIRNIKAGRDLVVDRAELRLLQAIDNKEPWAIALVVRTLGKDRGYVERHEEHVSGEIKSNIVIGLPAKDPTPEAVEKTTKEAEHQNADNE